jgi:cob(I)alamin adenosyltransferase
MMDRRPRILVFTGDGKGKTTAALGMALRAAGHTQTVRIIHFVKQDESVGELTGLKQLAGVSVEMYGCGFIPKPTSPNFPRHVEAAQEGLAAAREAVAACPNLLILDEICGAVDKGLLAEQDVLDLLASTSPEMCIVLTGRGATAAIIDAADTVTDMQCVKHGFDVGIDAQKGVES